MTRFYITDEHNRRMRDSKDHLFTCKSLEEAENVISFYFDSSYGNTFRIYDNSDIPLFEVSFDTEACEYHRKPIDE